MPVWPFSSRARAERADRKARELERELDRTDRNWESHNMTGGTAIAGPEPFDGALNRERRTNSTRDDYAAFHHRGSPRPRMPTATAALGRTSRPSQPPVRTSTSSEPLPSRPPSRGSSSTRGHAKPGSGACYRVPAGNPLVFRDDVTTPRSPHPFLWPPIGSASQRKRRKGVISSRRPERVVRYVKTF